MLCRRTATRTTGTELALAHAVGSKVEAAYRRGDFREAAPADAAMGDVLHHRADRAR
jgi:hypothetical protein